MKIKVLDISSGISLQLNKVYLIKFETASHFIIFENDIWYGVYKDNAEIVEEYKIMAVEAIKKAGEFFNMRCPLDGEAKTGANWYDTH